MEETGGKKGQLPSERSKKLLNAGPEKGRLQSEEKKQILVKKRLKHKRGKKTTRKLLYSR